MRKPLSLLAVLTLVVACGTAPEAGSAPPTTEVPEASVSTQEPPTTAPAFPSGFPVTVETPDGTVTLDEPPTRIVSLSPTMTEILFAVGAGDQVVAADEYSTYPEEAPDTALSGYTPNLEAISAFQPDLVVLSDDIDGIVASLQAIEIPVARFPAPDVLEEVYGQIEQVGVLTGHAEEAQQLADEMASEVEGILGSVDPVDPPLTYFHELDDFLYTVTSQTFLGSIYALAGLENIADAADPEGTGYPRLSPEYVISADPDLIFLADAQCCQVTAEKVAARPGWESLSAVVNGAVFEMDEDVASRWGPRVVDYLRAVVEAVDTVSG